MTIAIKTRNFSLNKNKMEGTFDKGDGLGWAPGYEKTFEGTGIDSVRYGKNYNRGIGICVKCDKFRGKESAVSEHCSLPAKERCQK